MYTTCYPSATCTYQSFCICATVICATVICATVICATTPVGAGPESKEAFRVLLDYDEPQPVALGSIVSPMHTYTAAHIHSCTPTQLHTYTAPCSRMPHCVLASCVLYQLHLALSPTWMLCCTTQDGLRAGQQTSSLPARPWTTHSASSLLASRHGPLMHGAWGTLMHDA